MFSKRKRTRTARLGKRRRKVRNIKIGAIAVTLIVISIGLVWVSRIDEFNIKTVIIAGNSVITKNQLEQAVSKRLIGSYLLLIPKTNILLFPKKSITASVLESFNRLQDAEIVVEDLQTIKLTVKERQSFALYCGEASIDTHEELGNCYFLDKSGFIFAKAPDFTGYVFFKYFGKLNENTESYGENPIGVQYMPAPSFREFTLFLESFSELDSAPTALLRMGEKDFEIHFDDGSRILFDRDQSLATILDNLQSVLESDIFRERGDIQLDYIDLRFGNKVFYKFVE